MKTILKDPVTWVAVALLVLVVAGAAFLLRETKPPERLPFEDFGTGIDFNKLKFGERPELKASWNIVHEEHTTLGGWGETLFDVWYLRKPLNEGLVTLRISEEKTNGLIVSGLKWEGMKPNDHYDFPKGATDVLTSRGIHVGSTREEVLKAYGGGIDVPRKLVYIGGIPVRTPFKDVHSARMFHYSIDTPTGAQYSTLIIFLKNDRVSKILVRWFPD